MVVVVVRRVYSKERVAYSKITRYLEQRQEKERHRIVGQKVG